MSYYAKWDAKDIAIVFNANGDTGGSEGATGKPREAVSYTPPTREGYTFIGWNESNTAVLGALSLNFPATDAESVTYFAVWTVNEISVTFDAMSGKFSDGTVSKIVTGSAGTPLLAPIATRGNYTFAHWSSTATADTEVTQWTVPTANATYYAVWTRNETTATFKLGAEARGTFADGSTEDQFATGEVGASITCPVVTVTDAEHDTFLGWKVEGADDNTAVRTLVFPEQSTSYVAVWGEVGKTVVTFYAQGGRLSGDAVSWMTPSDVPGATYTVPDDPTRANWVSLGWFTQPEGGIAAVTGTYPAQNTAYYAHWEARHVRVTLHAGEGKFANTQNAAVISAAAGLAINYETPVRSGYIFSGWAETAAGTSGVYTITAGSEDGKEYYAVWTLQQTGGGGSDAGGTAGATGTKVPVIVDGSEYNIGTTQTGDGTTTVTVDQTSLQKQLDSATETVIIPITPANNTSTAAAEFVVANVDEMAHKEMTLSIKVDDVSYDMRAVAIDTERLMSTLGATDPTKVPVNVTIKELETSAVTLKSGTLMAAPVSFTVTAAYGGQTVEVKTFEKYAQRVIEIPSNVDASQITTAVVVENGAQRHVPTKVFQKDGKWYARISSLTNSTYALINNPASFTDVSGRWYEASVTEMAGRSIISRYRNGTFGGKRSITRAEFAAILIRALGLPANGNGSSFADVPSSAWYCGAVGTAYEYGIINGRAGGSFDPTANVTRQEVMAMVHRAAGIAEFAGKDGSLSAFTDADSISAWARSDAQWNVGSGLMQGSSSGTLCGRDNISRAEAATVILRLLQKSGLVDVRTA